MNPLGPCVICGEMVYEESGEDMSLTDTPAYEHFDCVEEED